MITLPHTAAEKFAARSLAAIITTAALVSSNPAGAQSNVEEIIVRGQGGVGAIRLNEINDAGSRLGLSAFDIPASVDIISQQELATKGDYGAL
ncbi:MAG: hypothetical protein RL120_14395, partial [Gammaproteobacteria bacterium]